MAKYLIEDIIPPEKKHHRAHQAHHAKKAPGGGRSIHIEREVRPKTEKSEMKKPISQAFPEDPREMITEQMKEEVVETPTAEEAAPVESAFLSAATASAEPSVDAKIWTRGPDPVAPSSTHESIPPQFPEYTGVGAEGGGLRAWLPWLVGVGVFAIGGVLLFNFFGGATVTILPKHEQVPLEQKFTAIKTETDGKLAYAIMKETASSSLEVPATGEKTVTAKASGKIIVYNEQTTAQRLIKNTRFQSPTGKIYRISDSITIPKGTLSGGAIRPGTLEVTVYADEAGPEYNSAPVDFTVPGLKNSKIYDKVYARSKGPITGGASGTVKTVSDQDLKQAGEDLRVQLETKLRAKARGNLASQQIAYDQGIVVSLDAPKLSSTQASTENKAVVSAEGVIYVVTFKRDDLARAIVRVLSPESADENIDIKNLDALQFTMDPQKGDALLAATKLDFTLKGDPELSWRVDEGAIKTSLLGLPRARFNEILSQNPSVERANADLKPMWKRAFPQDPAEIDIVLVMTMPAE